MSHTHTKIEFSHFGQFVFAFHGWKEFCTRAACGCNEVERIGKNPQKKGAKGETFRLSSYAAAAASAWGCKTAR